jgi:hypothetical protein
MFSSGYIRSVIIQKTNKLHRSLRPLIIALIPGQQRSLDKLKTMRLRLANEVAAVINEFGPKLYDDFDEVRFCIIRCALSLNIPERRSFAFLSRLLLLHLRLELPAYGDGEAEQAPLMPKAICSYIQW